MMPEKSDKTPVINNFMEWLTTRKALKWTAGKFGEQVLTP